jgi:hypothetical protein
MWNSDRQDVDVANPDFFASYQRVRMSFRLARPRQRFDGVVENVGEAFREALHCIRGPVNVDRLVSLHGQRADVVDAHYVIGMIVGEQDRVDPRHAGGEQLKPELGRGVDEYACPAVGLNDRADAGSLVPWIRRSAHLTATTDLRNAKARPRAEERELQTVSTFRRLVVPCMSNGTPAVTMILSPGVASSRPTTAVFARSIISS